MEVFSLCCDFFSIVLPPFIVRPGDLVLILVFSFVFFFFPRRHGPLTLPISTYVSSSFQTWRAFSPPLELELFKRPLFLRAALLWKCYQTVSFPFGHLPLKHEVVVAAVFSGFIRTFGIGRLTGFAVFLFPRPPLGFFPPCRRRRYSLHRKTTFPLCGSPLWLPFFPLLLLYRFSRLDIGKFVFSPFGRSVNFFFPTFCRDSEFSSEIPSFPFPRRPSFS